MIRETALMLSFGLALALVPLQVQSQSAPMVTLRKPLMSIGIKAGFKSSMFFSDELSIGGEKIEDLQNNYKVGYFAALFCRFNLKEHHFLQTELSYNVSKGSVSIPNTLANSELIPDNALINQ